MREAHVHSGETDWQAWEAHSSALRTMGREFGPRPADDGRAGRGLSRHSRRKRGDRAQGCGERSTQRAGVSSTCVAPAFRTPLEPSRSLAEPAAALGSRPAESPRRQGGLFGLNPAAFPPEQPQPCGHAPTTRKGKCLSLIGDVALREGEAPPNPDISWKSSG
jgi:hypothetical protein